MALCGQGHLDWQAVDQDRGGSSRAQKLISAGVKAVERGTISVDEFPIERDHGKRQPNRRDDLADPRLRHALRVM